MKNGNLKYQSWFSSKSRMTEILQLYNIAKVKIHDFAF